MKQLNIYLAPFAYYVRLDMNDFEENKKKGTLQKWIENRKGMLSYEFIEFTTTDIAHDLGFPMKIRKLALLGSNVLCYHPFEHKTSASTRKFEPTRIISDSKDEVHFVFAANQSNKLFSYEKYYTGDGQPYISKISFYIDDSTTNLRECVEFSNGQKIDSYYHLISKSVLLQKPDWYALFDFEGT